MPSEAQIQLIYMRGAIASIPQPQQDAIQVAAAQIRDLVKSLGESGQIALALVGCEWAATDE